FDAGRYYVIRANALENNFRLYYYDHGRYQLASARVYPPLLGQWHTMRVVAVGDHIQGYLDGKLLIDHRDARYRSGKVGLWTYAARAGMDIPARYRDPAGYWTGFAARARVIDYNTDQVKPAEAPASVRDLADPRWKGRAGLANPLFGTTTTQVAALWSLWGDQAAKRFLAEVKDNRVKIVTS